MPLFNIVSDFLRRESKKELSAPVEKAKRYLPYSLKAVSRVRQDIKTWNDALQMAQSDEPKNFSLQLLYNEMGIDALLSSQLENRIQQVFSAEWELKTANGDTDEEQTQALRNAPAFRKITRAVLESIYYGYSLVELGISKNIAGEDVLEVVAIPRTNVVPQRGLFYADYSEDKTIPYREMAEYGVWILEFDSGGLGLLNKAVPHVLFKRFAQSCWSELCEIYGIPPRVMKTNTQDPILLNRAEQMMRDMGAAAWFIIDETETFEWAQAANTNGDVYKNLIALCNNELSLLISGAVIGQDTQNGSRSKDESAQEMLWQLVQADMVMVEEYWNASIIQALVKIGILKGDLRFAFSPSEDTDALWARTRESLPFYTFDTKWLQEKFGLEITGERSLQVADPNAKLSADFFD